MEGRMDIWKFTPVSYRTSALWGRCPKRDEGKKERKKEGKKTKRKKWVNVKKKN